MSASDSYSKQGRIPLAIWVFLSVFALRLLVLVHFSTSPYFLPTNGDMRFYNDWALRILKGQWTDHQAFYGLPGYAFFLAGIYCLAGEGNFFLVGFFQIAVEAAIGVLIFKISKEIFRLPDCSGGTEDTVHAEAIPAAENHPEIIGALAALGWAFFQPAQTFSIILMPTSWLVFAFWMCVWRVLKIRHASVWQPWFWMGLAIGAVAMMVATIFVLIPLIIVAIYLRLDPDKNTNTPRIVGRFCETPEEIRCGTQSQASHRDALQVRLAKIAAACAVLFAGVFAGASPCWIHNYFIAGEPVFLSAHSGVNFYIGNNATASGYPRIPPGMHASQEGMLKDSITMAEADSGRKLKRAEVSRFWSLKADAYIHAHFGDWLKLMARKFRNFWSAFQYDDLGLVPLFAHDGILPPGLRYGFVAALAIPGMFIAAWKYRRSRWVIAAIFLHMAALLPVFITERYRLAAVPGLLLMAAIGLWELWAFLVEGRWRQALLYAACTAAAVAFVAQPQRDASLWSLDFYNTGIKALEAANFERGQNNFEEAEKDTDRAQKNLETAFAYVPDNSEINFALGNLWLQKHDHAKAEQFYKRAIELNARHSGAYNNLGVIAMEEKRWKAAAFCFAHAIAIEPGDAKAHYLLAKMKLELDDVTGAAQEIERALKIKPERPEFQALFQEIRSRREKLR